MAKGFDMLRVKSAVKSRNKMNLDRSHLTTMEFGQILPLFCEELIPGDKYSVKGNYFSRMAPLVKPTYGRFKFNTVGAFVPYHQIAVDAEAFLAGKTTWQGVTPLMRYFTFYDLTQLFAPAGGLTTSVASTAHYDFKVIDAGGNSEYRALTNLGRFYYKILTCLGYSFPQNVDQQTTSSWYSQEANRKFSAYPFLAFVKLYNDYMSQSQRYNTSSLSSILYKIKNGINDATYYLASTGHIYPAGIRALLDGIRLCYDNDYFTSAWQNANTPLYSVESVNSINVPENGNALISSTRTDDFAQLQVSMLSSTDHKVLIGQRALDFLKSFDDWVRRNNYSGSREVQQIYSRFGIKPDDYKAHYSHIIYTDSTPISIGDVTAMASSSSETLGDYAGKGIMNGSKGLSYQSSDFGMLFILGYYTVSPMNAFGFDRSVLRVSPLDYYNPEFDGLGADAISYGEVYADPLSPTEGTPSLDDMVFGFTERYNSYRFSRDKITGQFRDYHSNAGDTCWHSGRFLSSVRGAGQMVAQSSSMNTLSPIDSEYNRIFSVTSGDVDHFYMTCFFEVEAVRPMLSLNQVPKLGEGDTVVPRNGNEIS